ncbi:MAG: endonuclease/exonuclease/phosphatase family protein, partial [Actinomycetota bacterium]|nr:endonuclease/exonuclease/phosphatase family protein [Actinomycetota bacterium]
VLPRAAGGRVDEEGPPGNPVRVLSANVLGGSVPAPRLVGLARRERADVLAVQELTPELDARLRRAFAHRVADPRADYTGTGIYSRFPLKRVPSPRGTEAAMSAAVAREPSGLRFTVVSVHPPPPVRSRLARWRRDLRALPPAARSGPPLVLAGDFNATLDHAELRRLLDTGYADAAAETGDGLATTWRTGRLLPPPVTIDHVLAERPVEARRVDVHDLPPSDHRAVLAELILRRPRGAP